MTSQQDGPDLVQVYPAGNDPGARWAPRVGPETLMLLDHLTIPPGSKNELRDEALSILSRCTPVTAPGGSDTGLVIGHVQSGKTMSFTTVTALARDNEYRLVIVITGISDPLFHQSTNRLLKDLQLNTRPDRAWQHFANPSTQGHERQAIEDVLADWADPSVPKPERRTVLITVMKNHRHLRNLIQLLSQLELTNIPSLIIDDEADQAGLNTLVARGDESTTYRRLLALRRALPHHTFLQYTATPQAPLLINLIDVLSPRFARVLSPGPEYAGGQEFFIENPQLVRAIPPNDIPVRGVQLPHPPPSLLYAMQIYFLGVAAGWVLEGGAGNRSMLVHPSQETLRHAENFHWVQQAKLLWQEVLALSEDSRDRQELLEDFHHAYEDLSDTVQDLPSFEQLVARLHHAIRRARIVEVNAVRGATPRINWRDAYAYILVGGQAMDRGFTLEGLTVTYMSRGLGVGNADTVQQRARFFGYKGRYLGYCRVFLESGVAAAYRHYVEHEEDIRKQLVAHQSTGQPLSEWKRAFFLHGALRPTRTNVQDLDYMRGDLRDAWYAPKAPHDSEDAIASNRNVADEFLGGLDLKDDLGHPKRTEMQKHRVASGVPLAGVYENLLTRLRVTRPDDSKLFTGVLLQIRRHLENEPDATCAVYQMSAGQGRERSVDPNDEVPNLFQGANYDGAEQTYPGDRDIRHPAEVTVQIHHVKVTSPDRDYDDVRAVTVWVPAKLSAAWVSQYQPGQN